MSENQFDKYFSHFYLYGNNFADIIGKIHRYGRNACLNVKSVFFVRQRVAEVMIANIFAKVSNPKLKKAIRRAGVPGSIVALVFRE